ncbi:MAG TPA: glycosyltransferase [Gemmatimonadales bacterium]|nr:glycosyltransferase [Gemmatimonadales bacterium]
MESAVIIATYNWPRALELALWGFAAQTDRRFGVVVADDGSGPETAALLERMRGETALDITHVWHEDCGFRKSEILNRAILATEADYLVFTDGDLIPRDDFMATHHRLAQRGRYLAGMTVRLPEQLSASINAEDVRAGRATDLRWLRAQGFRPGRHALRFSRSWRFNTVMDHLTTTPPRWRGGNASAWRDDIVAVNGFEMQMGYGGQDAEIGDRLDNLGVRPLRVRFRAPTVHLWHERPWRDEAMVRKNREHRQEVRASGATRARMGLVELQTPAGVAAQP